MLAEGFVQSVDCLHCHDVGQPILKKHDSLHKAIGDIKSDLDRNNNDIFVDTLIQKRIF